MNGYCRAGTIVLGGFDYHSGNRGMARRKTRRRVSSSGIIAYDDAVQTPVMIKSSVTAP